MCIAIDVGTWWTTILQRRAYENVDRVIHDKFLYNQ